MVYCIWISPNVQHNCFFRFNFILNEGEDGECLSKTAHRSAPGGSGAGGSVVIITKILHGNPHGRIFVQGGAPVTCASGAGGGKSAVIYSIHFTHFNSSVNDDFRARKTTLWTMITLTMSMMMTMTMIPAKMMPTFKTPMTTITTKIKIYDDENDDDLKWERQHPEYSERSS